jgi:hypothetical protein
MGLQLNAIITTIPLQGLPLSPKISLTIFQNKLPKKIKCTIEQTLHYKKYLTD